MNADRIFPGINDDDADLLHKIIAQLDASEEGVRMAAVNAATKFFSARGYDWSHVANAILLASMPAKKVDAKPSNDERNHPARAPSRPQPWDAYGRTRRKAQEFKPGIHEVKVIDSMYAEGRLRVILRLGERVIRAYVIEPEACRILRMSKGRTLRVHVKRDGNRWILGNIEH